MPVAQWPRADNAVTEVRFFTGTPLFAKPEKKHAESMQTGAARRRNRSCDRTRRVKPEWRGSGLLTRPQVARNHPGPPFRTSDPSGKGPGLLNRRESYVGSSPTWSSSHSALVAKSVDAPSREGGGQPCRFDSDRAHQFRPCYASGEAARLSIGRDGFESRTGRHRHQGAEVTAAALTIRLSPKERLLREQDAAGSSPAILTIRACSSIGRASAS